MGDKTGIEWTHRAGYIGATWNPVVGCEHVSEGCDLCYAAREASGRLAHTPAYAGLAVAGRFTGEVRLLPDRLTQPLRARKPRMWFVNSMSDLLHKDVPDEYIARVFAVAALCPHHIFQILTKRHARLRALLNSGDFDVLFEEVYWATARELDHRHNDPGASGAPALPLPNVWLGVSVENQKWADIRIPALVETEAAVRFLSCEPLLGPVNLRGWLCDPASVDGSRWPPSNARERSFDWVIAGGESGPKARPMHPDWARRIRDDCTAAGVPFFMKQHGEWVGGTVTSGEHGDKFIPASMTPDGSDWWDWPGDDPRYARITHEWPDGTYALRVGKRAAGRELDGRTWDEFPRVPEAVAR